MFDRPFHSRRNPATGAAETVPRHTEISVFCPRYRSGEESRWDFRFTIVWKDVETGHTDADRTAILEELFPEDPAVW